MTAPQTIDFEWQGATVSFIPSHDLYMQIEDRVSFARIASAFANAATSTSADLPMSHVSWVLFCVLRIAGVRVANPMDVHHAIQSNSLNWGAVIGQLISAYYGALPTKAKPEKKPRAAARTSRR